MSFFTSLKVSGSGLQAERLRVDLASANLANANSTRSVDGGPYRRRDPVLRAIGMPDQFGNRLDSALRQVYVERIRIDPSPPRQVFDPSHPDANQDGIVELPNVKLVEEMTNLMNAQRSFEANLKAIGIGREMAQRALRIGRSR
jgi:flagellar basal-body rod protein FlgC